LVARLEEAYMPFMHFCKVPLPTSAARLHCDDNEPDCVCVCVCVCCCARHHSPTWCATWLEPTSIR
jgi:hypothetical protein